jgi:hypothetical protein
VVTSTPAATSLTTHTRVVLEEASIKLLESIGCMNPQGADVPPLTTWEQFREYLGVADLIQEQDRLEAWWSSRIGITHDPLTRGTATRYDQTHKMRIVGWAWHGSFDASYQYIQDQTELLLWTLEKNKGFATPEVLEISQIQTAFGFQNLGEYTLHQSETRFSLLINQVEASGRIP